MSCGHDHGLDYGNHPLYTQSHNNPILHTYYLFRLINDKYIKKSDTIATTIMNFGPAQSAQNFKLWQQ